MMRSVALVCVDILATISQTVRSLLSACSLAGQARGTRDTGAGSRYIIAPSIFYRGYSYLVLKLFKLRVPSLNLEHSSGRANLTLKCSVMFKE